jgi:CRP-like cAMP-binding protein
MIEEKLLMEWGAEYKEFDKNEVIFWEGDSCHYYYQLNAGVINWVNLWDNGKEYLQNIIYPNQCVGELPLFDDGVYAATAIATTKSILLRLPKRSFKLLLEQFPAIHFSFSKLLTERLRFKFYLLNKMASDHPEQLIVGLLDYFKINNTHISKEESLVILTRQQIADLTGLRVETVIRVIRNLHLTGKLTIKHGKIFYAECA